MKDREILEHIKHGIDKAPIDILDGIKSQKAVKMMKHDEITRQETRKPFKPLMFFASAAAAFLLIFFNIQQFVMPDSRIYIDNKPGIEITTNKKDNVIKLEPINEDAAQIIEDIQYKNNSLKKVTEDIMDSLVVKGYIRGEDEIMLVSVYNGDVNKSKKLTAEMNDTIHNKLGDINKAPILLTQSLEKNNTIEEFANRLGISTGKMTFVRNMIILNPDLKTEDLVDLSLAELIEISRSSGIDIEKIINTGNDERIRMPKTQDQRPADDDYDDYYDDDDFDDHLDDDDYDDDDDDFNDDDVKVKGQRIDEAKAKETALGLVYGNITDFVSDDDEYGIEILAGGYEYNIKIDAYTGEVLEFEKDDIDDDD